MTPTEAFSAAVDRLASLRIFPALVIAFALALPVVVGLFDGGY